MDTCQSIQVERHLPSAYALHDYDFISEAENEIDKPLLGRSSPYARSPARLKVLFFVTGLLVAAFSQIALSKILWQSDILSLSTPSVVGFSLVWSFLTCFVVFSALVLLIRLLIDSSLPDESLTFSLEAHYIVGSVFSVSASWFSLDFLDIKLPSHGHVLSLLGLFIIGYGLLYRFSTTKIIYKQRAMSSNGSLLEEDLPTYQLLSSTMGLLVGICSQFILNFCLWGKDGDNRPFKDNLMAFSLLWSLITVVLTFVGCSIIRCVVDKESTSIYHFERIVLRMESHFVLWALLGIFAAWFMINISLGLNQQILPGVAMLVSSLLAFQGIILLFPEDQCVNEIEMSSSEDSDGNPFDVVMV